MRSEAPASEQASAENQEVSSSRKCSGCQKDTKNHFGPHGKKCCVVHLVDSLRLRVELLEKLVESEKRHGKEMKDQSALHQKRNRRSSGPCGVSPRGLCGQKKQEQPRLPCGGR